MPLDHFVSQVHLKNFYSPVLSNRLYAIRKSDLKRFKPRSEDVCRVEDGSTNAYLREDRVVEDFLLTIEPKYNRALAKLRSGNPDEQSIYVIAGFVAYVACCAPAAMRIGKPQLDSVLRTTAEILDGQGILPRAPEELGSKSITELLDAGAVHFDVDGKYPQALGISTIMSMLSLFGNSPWEILQTDDSASAFFTSDFPVAIEARGNSGIMNRIVPLAPNLAIRILPDVRLCQAEPDLSFAQFRFRRRRLNHADVSALNRLIVQCAEDAVFYRDDRAWIGDFIEKNRNYRIDCVITRIPYGTGTMHVGTQRIRHFAPATSPNAVR